MQYSKEEAAAFYAAKNSRDQKRLVESGGPILHKEECLRLIRHLIIILGNNRYSARPLSVKLAYARLATHISKTRADYWTKERKAAFLVLIRRVTRLRQQWDGYIDIHHHVWNAYSVSFRAQINITRMELVEDWLQEFPLDEFKVNALLFR